MGVSMVFQAGWPKVDEPKIGIELSLGLYATHDNRLQPEVGPESRGFS